MYGVSVIDILTVVIAAISIVISLWSASISRKNMIATNIASNRMEWIKAVRSLVVDFLNEYEDKNTDKKELIKVYNHLLLYFDTSGRTYTNLVNAMKKCLEEGYKRENSWAVIESAQEALDGPWVRMKREAGISGREERRIAKRVYKGLYGPKKKLWKVSWKEHEK